MSGWEDHEIPSGGRGRQGRRGEGRGRKEEGPGGQGGGVRRARPGWRSPGRRLSPRLGRSAGDPSPSPPLLSGHTAAPRRHSGTHPKGSLRSPPHHPAPSQPLPRFARAGAKTTQITGGTQLEAQKPPARLWGSGLWGSSPSDGLGRFKGARCSLPGWPAPWSRRAWGREKRRTGLDAPRGRQ